MDKYLNEPLLFLDHICPICLSALPKIAIPQCSHKFCKPCLTKYTELKISEGKVLVIPCPFTRCESRLFSAFIRTYLSSNSFEKYIKLYKKRSLEADINFRWCPQRSCEGYDVKNCSNELTCNQCRHNFCFLCASTWHGTSKCKISDDTDFLRWLRSNRVRQCPKCNSKTEKYDGCRLITCAKCNEMWCWNCGLSNSFHDNFSCTFSTKGFDVVWYCILLMISAPLTIPFWVGFFALGVILYDDIQIDNRECVISMIRRKPWIWLAISFISSPLVIIGGVCVLVVRFAIKLTPWKLLSEESLCIFTGIYVLFMSCLVLVIYVALASIAICLLPVIGIVLIPLKIYYQYSANLH